MGVNASEERLAQLSRRTFLSMWSYQNPFYRHGKELCDVLVVFGNDVLIFSDKSIGFKECEDDKELKVAWDRWFRKAVLESIQQLEGALNTIKKRPETIHLDAKVSSPFPLSLPAPSHARYHLVAIAHGSEATCLARLGRSSLRFDTRIKGDEKALSIGYTEGHFVHIFNGTALAALFESMDTTADLIAYLRERRDLFQGRPLSMEGEEDLIATYMRARRPDGRTTSATLSDHRDQLFLKSTRALGGRGLVNPSSHSAGRLLPRHISWMTSLSTCPLSSPKGA